MLRQAGVLATEEIMAWTPDSRRSTFAGETASLVFRGFLSYLLGLLAWRLLVCSVVGRAGRAAEEVGGQDAA
jgi:hypothetical protein